MDFESKGMLKDRSVAIRETLFHGPYYQRHLVGVPRLLDVQVGRVVCESNDAVFRTKLQELTRVFNVGRYLDTIVRTEAGWKFASRLCIQAVYPRQRADSELDHLSCLKFNPLKEPVAMVEGMNLPRFSAVRDAFASTFDDAWEQGAAVAVYLDGEPVVDLWGGHRDLARTQPWQRDTLANVWSCSKGVAATAVAMLVERGTLDYDAPLATYWPEFAANGKAAITLDQVLSHRAGLDGVQVDMALPDLYAGTPFTDALAAMAPLWQPGSRCVYHPVTFGHLLGEVVRRVDGRSLGRFIADEIAAPLGLSFFVGLPREHDHRAAEMSGDDAIYASHVEGLKSPYPFSFRNPELFAQTPNARAWRAAEIPAANGHSDARSLARMYGALARGGAIDGVRLITPAGIGRAARERFRGVDACSLGATVFAAGYRVDSVGFGPSVGPGNFGHTGWGGSVAFADPTHHLGFAFVTSRLLAFPDGIDPRRQRLLQAVYASL